MIRVIRTVQARYFRGVSSMRPRGAFEFGVVRRHVDLLRVSSALCPGGAAIGC